MVQALDLANHLALDLGFLVCCCTYPLVPHHVQCTRTGLSFQEAPDSYGQPTAPALPTYTGTQ